MLQLITLLVGRAAAIGDSGARAIEVRVDAAADESLGAGALGAEAIEATRT